MGSGFGVVTDISYICRQKKGEDGGGKLSPRFILIQEKVDGKSHKSNVNTK